MAKNLTSLIAPYKLNLEKTGKIWIISGKISLRKRRVSKVQLETCTKIRFSKTFERDFFMQILLRIYLKKMAILDFALNALSPRSWKPF